MESIPENPPEDIDPYTTLNLTPSASPLDVKAAYRKLALRHHPDKVSPSERISAHSMFQRIAFAYAILSSPSRRTLYDNTGSTSGTLAAADDDDFNWLSFFRTQYSSLSASAINDFSASYKQSDEERKDVLTAYAKYEGKMGKVYDEVMLSNPLVDENRFRGIIDGAVQTGEVEGYHAYVNETRKSKDARMKKARREAEEAAEVARVNEKYQSIFGGDGSGGRPICGKAAAAGEVDTNGMKGENKERKLRKADYEGRGEISDLAAIIQSRDKARSADFFDKLEAKYANASITGKAKKRKAEKEPDEEAFEKTKTRMAKAKAERDKKEKANSRAAKGRPAKRTMSDDVAKEEDAQCVDIDLEDATDSDEDDPESDDIEEDSEEKEVKLKRRPQKLMAQKAAAPVAKKRTIGRGRVRN
ncbi:MAG: hypothetical protein Q9216_004146 [Gyalolechia sp. 2 TL-2023]